MTDLDLYRAMLTRHNSALLVILTFLSIFISMVQATPSFNQSSSNCITFDSEEKIITIMCGTSDLTEIDNQLRNPVVLHRDENVEKDGY
jgi:hypothetical protein